MTSTKPQVAGRADLDGPAGSVRDEGSVDQHAIHHSEHRSCRDAEGDPHCSTPLDDLGVFGEPFGEGVIVVVHDRSLRAVEDAGLVGDVAVK